MMRVITYGTFDTLHYGHILLLERARAMGDYLIVGISSDEFNEGKGKRAHFDYETRKRLLQSLRCVDLIIPEHSWEQKREDIVAHKADIFIMGDDWKGKFDDLSDLCEVHYLPRTPNVSSTLMRQHLAAQG
ncbi:glycerol-3-phosphate cytidylyltransferase [Aquicoccus sp. SCR17]|nr:glycerol-3-phosphate cytidylyltransferase [Carideicomes alvinocaridis]